MFYTSLVTFFLFCPTLGCLMLTQDGALSDSFKKGQFTAWSLNIPGYINPLTPGDCAKKCLLKPDSQAVFRLSCCLAKKNQNCPKHCLQVKHYTSFHP